ncbi:MAG: hypothetical protein AABY00_00605 [Nanoarchaeota archaeon]
MEEDLYYFPEIVGSPMIYHLKRAEGICLNGFLVMRFEKGYDPSKSFRHTKFTVPEGSFERYKETVFEMRRMQQELARTLNIPVLAELRPATPEELRDLTKNLESEVA